VRKIARRILEEMGFEITEAEDGAKALDACKLAMPEAVLLDWNMPVMDGFEFLGHLRRMPGGDAPKVVFCTTENDMDHISRALHAGANEYIMKPFDKDIGRHQVPGSRFDRTPGTDTGLNLIRLPVRGPRDPARL
jgi:two-component system chemotaxis response regulator CheY